MSFMRQLFLPYRWQSTRPDPDGAVVEQSSDDPLGLMGDLVAHHLQNVVHGSFTAIVHVVNAGAVGQQQIHYVWICVLAGHVQRAAFVLVHHVDISPRPQQSLAHLEVPLEVPHLLVLGARGI